ncbi:protein transport protein Sec24A isoform X2 [Maniola jurtina]|uniref:protein transport protein Sec24A isoform X2 n=1 Tax=Maniola jurtina TaxID=191418 RepID=UPI001E68D7E6|nr:protein transport protein Sec24A isoform X2 [Maniola jurtina]
MAHIPNPYNNVPGQQNSNPGAFQQYDRMPPSQLPGTLKQDGNLNNPGPIAGFNSQNNLNQSASSSPAFNHPGMMPPPTSLQSSPVRPLKPISNQPPMQNIQNIPMSSPSVHAKPNTGPSSSPYPPNAQHQINNNAPPLIPSSQYSQPVMNGPMPGPNQRPINQYPPPSSSFSPSPLGNQTPISSSNAPMNPAFGNQRPPTSMPPGLINQPNTPLSGPLTGPRNSPLTIASQGNAPTSSVSNFAPPIGPLRSNIINGPSVQPTISAPMSGSMPPKGLPTGSSMQDLHRSKLGPQTSQPQPQNQHNNGPSTQMTRPPLPNMPPMPPMQQGTQSGQLMPPMSQSGLQSGPPKMPPMNLQSGPPTMPSMNQPGLQSGPLTMPPMSQPGLQSGPPKMPPMNQPGLQSGPPTMPPMTQPGLQSGPPTMPPMSQPGLQSGPPIMAPMSQPMPGPASGPATNMQNRYPQMQYSDQQQRQMQQNISKQFPTNNMYGVTQQMGQLSVTKQGFDQLWGHQMVDLLQCKHILPEYPEDPPEIRLGHQFADSPNCSPEIFRCTVNRIPETNSLLQKSRLPLGILIHPFKDLNHLPVIQCTTIVRCRACRTYINPFVYFVDAKRWKCNLCYRVNDLPEEFQYDPVSRSYGDPSRRPEIKSATIEFIAPSEYMLRPPQPAVYLFLLDVSQIARESGYLQVVCDTLKSNLEQLPGDARTQIGFICYDAHVHYYLMSDGLTRPKEMTVLDIDDIFLPSPESLLVNLGEYMELIKELLTILPQRYSAPGVPASALGAALQAAYKLMAPTGGRITVFQTCLPNIGPGALQSREDPNARSSKDVAHLNPATDFYKRLALDCSGAQVAVDLFLLSSQYCDLATLSGMSKFSAGTVYHIPLFRAQRAWQSEQLTHMFTRYLTRKIGFEAVLRVRCTRGVSVHTFHGNFFVRSTDLLSLPNVSPDAGFGMQLTIEESLADLQQVCFQAALLYTSSKGERRIRVHTLALPTANTLPDVLHSADQQCIVGLLSKMAVDRCATASMSEAKEALINVAVDMLSAHRLAQNLPVGSVSSALHAPVSMRLLPLYILALLKRKAFRTGTSTRLDERVADMCFMKSAPLCQVMRAVYPDLYALHTLSEHVRRDKEGMDVPDPPRLQLTAERINITGAYLLDDGENMIIYVCHGISPAFLSETFGVASFNHLPDEARSVPKLEADGNELLHAFIDKLNDDRPYPASVLMLRDNSASRQLFTERLVEDRVESALSYYEFLQHVKTQVK